jgi:polyhydroxyalkanoate synthase
MAHRREIEQVTTLLESLRSVRIAPDESSLAPSPERDAWLQHGRRAENEARGARPAAASDTAGTAAQQRPPPQLAPVWPGRPARLATKPRGKAGSTRARPNGPAAAVRLEMAPATPAAPIEQGQPEKQRPEKQQPVKQQAMAPAAGLGFDLYQLANTALAMIEQGGKVMDAYLRPRLDVKIALGEVEDLLEVATALGEVAASWLRHPQQAIDWQAGIGRDYAELWHATLRSSLGEPPAEVVAADPKDRRFADPQWSSEPFFSLLKQGYLLHSRWISRLAPEAAGLDAHTVRKADFYLRQFADAMSPSNFLLTNPELLRETANADGTNLVRGMRALAEDLEAGHGRLKIRQTDTTCFEIGRNIATTPGKVIYQNALMQLIQYTPTTATVLRRPVLIIPPWINKYYILDLNKEKSFIKWCVDQGLTTFVISWVNPGPDLAAKTFADYMYEGPLRALDIIAALGAEPAHAVGYCIGGTLLAVMLAFMAKRGDERLCSATFLTTQTDFSDAGEVTVFIDEKQVQTLERRMLQAGVLDGKIMASVFNMLRANDLIWPYFIDSYLKGKAPAAFDLLYWNSDSTCLPAANHAFYLRHFYLENRLAKGELIIADQKLDLSQVRIPVYSLAAREDHVAPATSVFRGAQLFGGAVRFVLAGSGHIAGVVNPPASQKYAHWTGERPTGGLSDWLAKARQQPGSWWPDWLDWIRRHDTAEVPARIPGSGRLPPLDDAPGSYVRMKTGPATR